MKQLVPARCSLCTSKKQYDGKVFDLHSYKPKDVLFFTSQHCGGQQHRRLLAERKLQDKDKLTKDGPEKTPCQALSLIDESHLLHEYAHHFKLWITWRGPCQDLQRHSYVWDSASGTYTIRHYECTGFLCNANGKTFCEKCKPLISLRRNVAKCALKKLAAETLFAKIFETEEQQRKRLDAAKEDVLWHRHRSSVEKIFSFEGYQLQQWVRSTFLSTRYDQRNAEFKSFMDLVVTPCLSANLATANQHRPILLQAQVSFEHFLSSPSVDELEKIRVMIAQASLTGKLESNPLFQGLILSCLRVAEREQAGLSLQGQIGKASIMYSEAARELASEAGRTLCLASRGNAHLLKLFGAHTKPFGKKNVYKSLQDASLPLPFNALDIDGRLSSNLQLIDQLLSAMTNTSGRN